MAYEIIFYERENGKSEIWNFLEDLRQKSVKSKNARIQYKQILLYIELLQNNGTLLPNNITKHIEDNIWELRPGSNRIFYFYFDKNTFVLLHSFRKKTQKQNAMIIFPERRLMTMKTWDDYKHYIQAVDTDAGQDLDEIEEQAAIISTMIQQRHALGLSQRELASLCGMPQSSVARIESSQTTPSLTTLLRLLKPLGLKLTISK